MASRHHHIIITASSTMVQYRILLRYREHIESSLVCPSCWDLGVKTNVDSWSIKAFEPCTRCNGWLLTLWIAAGSEVKETTRCCEVADGRRWRQIGLPVRAVLAPLGHGNARAPRSRAL